MPIYRGSWYSQAPAFGWFDKEDRPGSAAYQVDGRPIPDWQQGIALPSRKTLGQWYNVTPPGDGIPYPMQQTDIGPAKSTGRGVDISAVAAHQMGYTPRNFPTDAGWKVEPRDEPRGLGSPAGMPVQAGDLSDNTDEARTAIASGPPQQQGRRMPDSLMDMFQPRDYGGQPTGVGDLLAQRQNSLIGLGLGLMGGTRQDPYGQALRGYAQGASSDQDRYQSARNLAERQAERKQAQSNFERQFARSDPAKAPTDFTRAARDLGLTPGTPEHTEFGRKWYSTKFEGEWKSREIIDPRDPDGERKITVDFNERTGQYRYPNLPDQTGTAGAAPPVNWSGSNAPIYGQDGNYTPAAAAAAPAVTRGITLPSGEVVMPPPGANKEARKAWAADVSKTVADMQTGKMTEAQGTKAIYAAGMELAQQELEKSSHLGTSPQGKGLGALPFGVGAFFQSNEYQNYRNAKDAWLNAKLRAESGATINPDEFARDDRIYFPQPGEGPEQIAAKKVLREHITRNTKRAAGPGYTSPPPLAPPVTPAAPSGLPPGIKPPPEGFILRQSNR